MVLYLVTSPKQQDTSPGGPDCSFQGWVGLVAAVKQTLRLKLETEARPNHGSSSKLDDANFPRQNSRLAQASSYFKSMIWRKIRGAYC